MLVHPMNDRNPVKIPSSRLRMAISMENTDIAEPTSSPTTKVKKIVDFHIEDVKLKKNLQKSGIKILKELQHLSTSI